MSKVTRKQRVALKGATEYKVYARRKDASRGTPKLRFLVGCHTRKAARHYCRNNYYSADHDGLVIKHPDGTKESFTYNGVL